MLKSKAVDILRTFSKDEFTSFEKFTASPYFNTNNSIVRLVNELKIFHPDYESDILTEEYLYKKVFGKDKYSYSVMRNLMSLMLQLCESFLLNNRLNKDLLKSPDNILELLDEFQNRNIDNLFTLRLRNAEKIISREKYDSTHYKNNVRIINFILDDEYNKVSFKNNLKDIFFRKAIFELCFIANSLYRNANSINYISLENNIKAEESYFFIFLKCIDINKFLKETEKLRSSESVVIEIYFKLVLLILYPDNLNNYYEVKKSIFKNINKFSNREKYSLLNILRNYVLHEYSRGADIPNSEIRTINLEMLETIDFKKDKMESILGIIFIGIFLEAASKNEHKFAQEFIDKYSVQLRREIRKDIHGFASSYIEFMKRNYERSLEKLSHVKPPNKVYFIHIKQLYMKIYFELGHYDEGLSVIDSYRHYLDNKKDLNRDKRNYFMKICRSYLRLYRLKMSPEKYTDYDVVKFIRELQSDNLNIETKWMLSKAEELKKLFK